MKNIFLFIIKTLIYIFLGLLPAIITSCFMVNGLIYYISLIILSTILGILTGIIFENSKIKYVPPILVVIMAISLFLIILPHNTKIIIEYIDTLGDITAGALICLIHNPNYDCYFPCGYITKIIINHIIYLKVIIFFIIVITPFISVYKTSKKIINLYLKI